MSDREYKYSWEQGGGYGFDYREDKEVTRFAATKEQNLEAERIRNLPCKPTPKPESLNGNDQFRPCVYCRNNFLSTFVKCEHTILVAEGNKLTLHYPNLSSESFSIDGSDILNLRAALKKNGLYGEESTLGNGYNSHNNHLRSIFIHSSDRDYYNDYTIGNLLYKARLGLREDIFGVCAFIWHKSGDKRILTIDRPRKEYDYYKSYPDIGLPGGQVEKYKSFEDTIIEKCLEKTGIVIDPKDLEVLYEGPDKNGDYPNGIVRAYLVKKYAGKVRTRKKENNVKWLPSNSLFCYRGHSFDDFNKRLLKHMGIKV